MEIKNGCLVLHGGVDISPHYYHQVPGAFTQRANNHRDAVEFQAVMEAQANKLPIVGICRGAQMICIAAGGQLWQHSEGHQGPHELAYKFGTKHGEIEEAPAWHHQIMDLSMIRDGAEVIAWCPQPTRVFYQSGNSTLLNKSPEIVFFPALNALAIQPHPEWSSDSSDFKVFVRKIIEDKFGLEGVL